MHVCIPPYFLSLSGTDPKREAFSCWAVAPTSVAKSSAGGKRPETKPLSPALLAAISPVDLLGITSQVPIIQLFAIRDGWISPPMSHFPEVCTLLSVQQGWNPPWVLPGPSLYFLRGPLGPMALL